MYIFEIKKSKFIAYLYEVTSKEEVTTIYKQLKKDNKKASHVCYAYIIKNGSSAGKSDDGEPSGSAGSPIYKLMQLKNMTDKAVFVVRYFGGKKLGVGPLTRAYVTAAKNVIKETEINNQ